MKSWRSESRPLSAGLLVAAILFFAMPVQAAVMGAIQELHPDQEAESVPERELAAHEQALKKCLDATVDGKVPVQEFVDLLSVLPEGREAAAIRMVVEALQPPQLAIAFLEDALALFPCPQQKLAIRLLVKSLRKEGQAFALPAETSKQMLKALAEIRRGAQLEILLPVLELMLRQDPLDPRLLHCLGEGYGKSSALFSAAKALNAFSSLEHSLYDAKEHPAASRMTSGTKAASGSPPQAAGFDVLVGFLPELSAQKQAEQLDRYYEQLCRYQRPLRKGRAIGTMDPAAGQMPLDQRIQGCFGDARNGVELRLWLEDLRKDLLSGSNPDAGAVLEEAEILGVVAESLKPCKRGQSAALDDLTATKLVDRISRHRRKGRLGPMLTALVLFQELRPDEPLVLYGLGEAYGTQSPWFDPAKALAAFDKLTGQLETPTPPTKKSAQARYQLVFDHLPELSGGNREGRIDWFRRKVGDFCELLRRGEPISLWSLRDPRLEELQEDLIVAMRSGVNKEILDVLGQMLAIHSEDPGTLFLRAKVLASFGDTFDATKSLKDLERFLEITSESKFESNQDQDPRMNREDVARRLKSMAQFTAKDDLQELRIEAKELQRDLTPAGGKPQPKLHYPDIEKLRTEIKNREKLNQELRDLETKIADAERKLASARETYRQWQARDRQLRKGLSDPQPYLDEIQKWNEVFKKHTRKQEQVVKQVEEKVPAMEDLQKALQAFESAGDRSGRRRR